ncbi:hypothetical protein [Niabella hibiscisoli]|uniref:hypothetical protein n=1 Tax=Niabella hibiscisoli TaxID=1825928 RepID=UPI001F0D8F23|nr:hypothetical protein [Niabella hibiscisoli]MCH5718336.1 hypothetical protein [Niabella hibiscisoli]
MIPGLYRLLGLVVLLLPMVSVNASVNAVSNLRNDSIPLREQVGAAALPKDIAPIKAPFKMPQLKRPVFPSRSISITENGAKEGSKVTAIIQQTIQQLSDQGVEK